MNKIFNRLGRFIEEKRALVLIASVILLLGAVLGASRLGWATGLETMVSTNSQVYKDYQEFNQYFGNETLIVMVKGDATSNLIQLDNIQAMDAIEQKMSATDGVAFRGRPRFCPAAGHGSDLRQSDAALRSGDY